MDSLLIGTSGYDYPEWKGVFYPETLKRADFLSYYATRFNALELNNTFYNMPDSQRLLSFYERSEGRVSFSVKANRILTHEIPSTWKNFAEEFKTALRAVQEKDVLSAVLFQFPQSFHYIPENRIYLAELIKEFEGFPVVVEFRHEEWIKPSVMEGLEKRGASIAFCDMPALKHLPKQEAASPFIGPIGYVRLHGRNAAAWYSDSPNGSSRYTYDYSQEELEQFVPVVNHGRRAGKKVQVFFNNHPKGSGALNAEKLKELL